MNIDSYQTAHHPLVVARLEPKFTHSRRFDDEQDTMGVVEHAGFTSLEKLYICKKYQNQGIGSALLAQVFEQDRKQASVLRLRVLRVNPARKFYEKHGFQVTDEARERLFMTRVFADDSDS